MHGLVMDIVPDGQEVGSGRVCSIESLLDIVLGNLSLFGCKIVVV
jgi:hypothetical protein